MAKHPKWIGIIFREMFKRVGVRFTYKAIEKDGWFHQHEWTQAEEDDYKKWLRKWLDDNCRQYVDNMNWRKSMPASIKEKTLSYFLFLYGWRIKEESIERY